MRNIKGLYFDLDELRRLHEERQSQKIKEIKNNELFEEEQKSFVLKQVDDINFEECRRAYEEIYQKKGNFYFSGVPKVCFSKELDIPSNGNGYNRDVLKAALKGKNVGLSLTRASSYDDGPRIYVKPKYFMFDMKSLNSKRSKVVAESIEKAVTELVEQAMSLDLEHCYNAYKQDFIENGSFSSDFQSSCSTNEVKLDVIVPTENLCSSFFQSLETKNHDGRMIRLSVYSRFDDQYARAFMSHKTFVKDLKWN